MHAPYPMISYHQDPLEVYIQLGNLQEVVLELFFMEKNQYDTRLIPRPIWKITPED